MDWDVARSLIATEQRLVFRWVVTSGWLVAVVVEIFGQALLVVDQLLDSDAVARFSLNLVFLVFLLLRVNDTSTRLRQQQTVHVELVRPKIGLLNLLEFIKVNRIFP